ncbi:MAG: hypothetical protein ABI835_18320 [Chloroflexota bacterium]
MSGMVDPEKLEKTRQAVMRMRELLDIMRAQLEEGEQDYVQLFSTQTADDVKNLKEKERQGLAALELLDDPSSLAKSALHMRFFARELERDFEQLYDNLMTE